MCLRVINPSGEMVDNSIYNRDFTTYMIILTTSERIKYYSILDYTTGKTINLNNRS